MSKKEKNNGKIHCPWCHDTKGFRKISQHTAMCQHAVPCNIVKKMNNEMNNKKRPFEEDEKSSFDMSEDSQTKHAKRDTSKNDNNTAVINFSILDNTDEEFSLASLEDVDVSTLDDDTTLNVENTIHDTCEITGTVVPLGTVFFDDVDKRNQMEFVGTNIERSMANFYKLADSTGVRRTFVDEFFQLIKQEKVLRNFNPFDERIINRTNYFNRIAKRQKRQPPEKINITLESGERVEIIRMNYREQLMDMFSSKIYGDTNSFDHNANNVFSSDYNNNVGIPPNHLLNSKWYKDTYDKKFIPGIGGEILENEWLLFTPQGYTDGTNKSKRKIEPIAIIDPRLKKKARSDHKNWIVVGYMPSMYLPSEVKRRHFQSRDTSKDLVLRDYHSILEVILRPLVEFITKKPKVWVRRGNYLKLMRVWTEFSTWTVDNLAGDTLCGRLSDKNPSSMRMTQSCLTTFKQSGMSHHTCSRLHLDVIKILTQAALGVGYGFFGENNDTPLEDREEVKTLKYSREGLTALKVKTNEMKLPSKESSCNIEEWIRFMSTVEKDDRTSIINYRRARSVLSTRILREVLGCKVADNSLYDLPFGANQFGIFRATTSDILHTMESGIFPNVLDVVIGKLSDGDKLAVDTYVNTIFGGKGNRSGESGGKYPRKTFSHGFCKLTDLEAFEKVGKMFVISILLSHRAGRELIAPILNAEIKDEDKKKKKKGDATTKQKKSKKATLKEPPSTQNASKQTKIASTRKAAKGNNKLPTVKQKSQQKLPTKIVEPIKDKDIEQFNKGIDLDIINELKDKLPGEHARKLNIILQDFWSKKKNQRNVEVASNYEIREGILDYRQRPETPSKEKMVDTEIYKQSTKIINLIKGSEKKYIKINLDQLQFVIETLLAYWAFLKYGTKLLWSEEGFTFDQACKNLEFLRRVMVEGIDKGEGTSGWSTQKFTEMIHFLGDINFFGDPDALNTQLMEENLKEWGINPAKTAQKRDDGTFNLQMAYRYDERLLLQKIIDSNNSSDKNKENNNNVPNTFKKPRTFTLGCQVFLSNKKAEGYQMDKNGNKKKGGYTIEPIVADWFYNKYFNESEPQQKLNIKLFSEMKLLDKDENLTIIRCHPDYDNSGRWNDYLLVRYYDKIGQTEITWVSPARVIAFFSLPNENTREPTQVLVQEIMEQLPSEKKQESSLFRHYTLAHDETDDVTMPIRSKFKAFPLTCIDDSTYCIELNPSKTLDVTSKDHLKILHVKCIENEWPKAFLQSHKKHSIFNKKSN